MNKDRVYVIGLSGQADRVRSAAKYYISMRKHEVRCNPYFESESLMHHMKNLLWADEVYIIPNMDGTISAGMVLTKLAARILGKKVEQHYAERRIKSWVHNASHGYLYHR